jgi:class 3 adenylate cyclase/DNA-binding transcriptional MerR regulator
MIDAAKTATVTSKDIMEKTGISRATLNNYIKMGLLPKPIVASGEKRHKGVKQIGFFPEEVLARIQDIKKMKHEGMSMDSIIERLAGRETVQAPKPAVKPAVQPIPDVEPASFLPNIGEVAQKIRERQDLKSERLQSKDRMPSQPAADVGRRFENKDLKLSIGDLRTPAYLINHNFEIEWINREAEEFIFNKDISSIIDIESRNIFKLFFSWEFHTHLRNWEEIIGTHMAVMKSKVKKNSIANLYNGISAKETNFLEKLYDQEPSIPSDPVQSTPLGFITTDGRRHSYQIYTMSFREGIFFVYIPAEQANHELMQILSNRGRVINELLNQRMPSLVSLCVLVADIQDSVRICGELLPEEYFELVNELWKTVGCSFDKYNGIFGKHAGDGILYYFLKRPGNNYIMDSINCALEMREKVREFSSKWKLRKGWMNDIYLNTAINEGQEFFGAIHSSANVEFTALGDSINYTARLSDFARYGSIWTTKNVISKLSQEERSKIRFGVHRKHEQDHEIFLENSFSRIMDLAQERGRSYSQFVDIATLPITEISEKN